MGQSGLLLAMLTATVVTACPGQEAAGKRRREDNAAPLYELAVAEYERIVAKLQAGEAGAESWARTALARSLFAAAATRTRCEFATATKMQAAQRQAGLIELAKLVRSHGLAHAKTRPELACRDAVTLLQFHRHWFREIAVDEVPDLLDKEWHAVALMRAGLRAMQLDRAWPVRRKRYAAGLLAYQQRRRDLTRLQGSILEAVAEKVELHRARLRDMHMHEAGGFDAGAMVRRLQELVRKCMARADVRTRNQQPGVGVGVWLTVAAQSLPEVMPKPPKDASVADKATFGMAQLLMATGSVGASVSRNQSALDECRSLLARPAKSN